MGRGFRSATNLIPWLHAVRFVKLFLPCSKRPDSYFCSDAVDWNHQTPGTHLPKRWPPVSRLRSASKECLKYMVMPQGLLAPRLTVGIFNYQFLFFSVYLILIYWHSNLWTYFWKKMYISTIPYNFEYMLNTWWLRLGTSFELVLWYILCWFTWAGCCCGSRNKPFTMKTLRVAMVALRTTSNVLLDGIQKDTSAF